MSHAPPIHPMPIGIDCIYIVPGFERRFDVRGGDAYVIVNPDVQNDRSQPQGVLHVRTGPYSPHCDAGTCTAEPYFSSGSQMRFCSDSCVP